MSIHRKRSDDKIPLRSHHNGGKESDYANRAVFQLPAQCYSTGQKFGGYSKREKVLSLV